MSPSPSATRCRCEIRHVTDWTFFAAMKDLSAMMDGRWRRGSNKAKVQLHHSVHFQSL